jgi:4-carboxymuconolactone decarboxylase
MARIPYPDPPQEFTTLSVQLNLFRMLAHAGTTGKRVLSLGNALLSQLELPPKLRELAILQVAHESGADYEWVQHVALARSVGVTQAQIEAIEHGSVPASLFNSREQRVLLFTKEVYRGSAISDEDFVGMTQAFTSREIVELLLLVGYYTMLARFMKALEIDIDEPAGERLLAPSSSEGSQRRVG